jgi:1-acyl-sn-glycerol-3-phosphate acyltransferase
MRIARCAWDYALLAIGALLTFFICGIWAIASCLLFVLLPARTGRRVGRAGAMWAFRIHLTFMEALGAWRLDLSALDELRNAGPLILAPNHPCLVDAMLVVSRLPNVLCVMKGSLAANFLLGPAARLARYVPNSSLRRLLTLGEAELRAGGQLLIFPEGTRTVGDCVGPLTEAVGALSRRANVPVQVLIIESSAAFLGKEWRLMQRPPLPVAWRVRLGHRFDPPSDVRAFTSELQRHFARELAGAGGELVQPRSAGVREAPHLRG